jgi:hypothetical protein
MARHQRALTLARALRPASAAAQDIKNKNA